MLPSILSLIAVLAWIGTAVLLPAGIAFVGTILVVVGLGVLAAEARRDAGPRFRAPVFIGR